MPVSGVNPEAAAAMALQKQAAQAAASRVQGAMGQGPGGPMPPANGLSNPGNPANPPPFASATSFDPRGIQGIAARGDNVYMGGLPSAPGAGRPRNPTPTHADMADPQMQGALQRRMQQYGQETQQHEIAAKRRGPK